MPGMALLARSAADMMLRTARGGETSGELVERVERLCRDGARRPRQPAHRGSPSPAIVGDSPGMRELFALVERVDLRGVRETNTESPEI